MKLTNDMGYDDGYTVGYNRLCVPERTTLIAGTDSDAYRSAYANGLIDGAERIARRRNSDRAWHPKISPNTFEEGADRYEA